MRYFPTQKYIKSYLFRLLPLFNLKLAEANRYQPYYQSYCSLLEAALNKLCYSSAPSLLHPQSISTFQALSYSYSSNSHPPCKPFLARSSAPQS